MGLVGPLGGDWSGPYCAPSILITFINMVLFKKADKAPGDCKVNMFYSGQEGVQMFLVLAALLCVPWMLFIKPFILRSRWRKAEANKVNICCSLRCIFGVKNYLNFMPKVLNVSKA